MIFVNLPKDLVHTILSWEGSLKFRNGIYMTQMRTSEETRKLLQTLIAQKVKSYKERNVYWNTIQISIPTFPLMQKRLQFYFESTGFTYNFIERWCGGWAMEELLEEYSY